MSTAKIKPQLKSYLTFNPSSLVVHTLCNTKPQFPHPFLCHWAKRSNTLLTLLIFKAKYGDPYGSGWFTNITVLYRSVNFCREKFCSLQSIPLPFSQSILWWLLARLLVLTFFVQSHPSGGIRGLWGPLVMLGIIRRLGDLFSPIKRNKG